MKRLDNIKSGLYIDDVKKIDEFYVGKISKNYFITSERVMKNPSPDDRKIHFCYANTLKCDYWNIRFDRNEQTNTVSFPNDWLEDNMDFGNLHGEAAIKLFEEIKKEAEIVKIATYMFLFDNIEGYPDSITFCAYSEKEAKSLFDNWCINDEHLTEPYEASCEKVFLQSDYDEYGDEYDTSGEEPLIRDLDM